MAEQTDNSASPPTGPLTAGGLAAPSPAPSPPRQQPPPPAQLAALPQDELKNLAEEFGLDPAVYKTRQQLAAALQERRQMIATLDRAAMLEVVKWGRRPVPINAGKEALAQEIVRTKAMRFEGLSGPGLGVLARLRGLRVKGDEPASLLIKKLRKQEGLFARLGRKHRAMLGTLVANLIGDAGAGNSDAYQFLPPQPGQNPQGPGPASGPRGASIREEIEEAGLIGGLAGRIKREADVYLNQKLDEIEARIDRKLEEIDRRLAEWRDKEVANRIRIVKITLWASVIVAGVSLVYAYAKVYFVSGPPRPGAPAQVHQVAPPASPGGQ